VSLSDTLFIFNPLDAYIVPDRRRGAAQIDPRGLIDHYRCQAAKIPAGFPRPLGPGYFPSPFPAGPSPMFPATGGAPPFPSRLRRIRGARVDSGFVGGGFHAVLAAAARHGVSQDSRKELTEKQRPPARRLSASLTRRRGYAFTPALICSPLPVLARCPKAPGSTSRSCASAASGHQVQRVSR
jgi:hypothetical protein